MSALSTRQHTTITADLSRALAVVKVTIEVYRYSQLSRARLHKLLDQKKILAQMITSRKVSHMQHLVTLQLPGTFHHVHEVSK